MPDARHFAVLYDKAVILLYQSLKLLIFLYSDETALYDHISLSKDIPYTV